MTDEQQVAPEGEATEEVVSKSEATENTDGQVQDQPAEEESQPEAVEPEAEEVSKSKARRERRKAEMKRLEDEARAAKGELAALEDAKQKAAEAAQTNTPPVESDFQDYNAYLIAVGTYESLKAIDGRAVREAEENASKAQARIDQLREQTQREIHMAWNDQVVEARTRYADFEQVAFTAPISDGLAEMVATSDMGADVAYYLGTNRDEAARISHLTPLEQAKAIGRIEAQISLPKPKSTPQAPDPVAPVKPRGTAQKDPSKMSMAEYKAARMAGKL